MRLARTLAAAAGLLVAAPWALTHWIPVSPTVGLGSLALVFTKMGCVVYGGGYVLLAFLRADLVTRLGWLTTAQLLDATAVGQVTPGPVFTAATFIGFQLAGLAGAVVATAGIFLPSFLFVGLSAPLVRQGRQSPLIASFMDGLNAAACGLMAAVTWPLAKAALVDGPTVLLAVVAGGLLVRGKVNSGWLVAGGALAGVLLALSR